LLGEEVVTKKAPHPGAGPSCRRCTLYNRDLAIPCTKRP
jgi:hypothetical protein